MATFSSCASTVAYDKNPTQPLGALSSGIGYNPATLVTATLANTYIGGATETIGYGKGVAEPAPEPAIKAKAQ